MGATSLQDLGPGLHVRREVDPEQRAATLAAELGAELCRTGVEVEGVLTARRSLSPLDGPTLAALEGLARRLERAHGMLDRTRQRAEAAAGARLSAAGALAIHPDTVRERAARLVDARHQLQRAEEAVAEHEAIALGDADEADDADGSATSAAVVPASAPRTAAASMRLQRNRAVGALVAAFGLGLILLALGVVPLWAALVPPLLAALWALRVLRPAGPAEAGPSEESSHLSEVGAFTDELFGARRRSWEHDSESARRAAERSRAEEELRVAERAWRDLAGEHADPAAVEDVVRRFDPQHEEAALIAAESVGVRAVEAARRQLVDRWVEAWEGLGRDVPAAEGAPAAVAALRAEAGRAVLLVGEAADHGADVARAAPLAPVVVLVGPDG